MRDLPGELIGRCPVDACPHGLVLASEEDAAAAAAELDRGDVPHAAHHIAAAIANEPLRADWRALLERVLKAAPDPLTLFPVHAEPAFAGYLAAHASALARQAEPGRALILLVKAARARPGIPYLAWAADWFDTPGSLRRAKASELIEALEAWLKPNVFVRSPKLTGAQRRDMETFRPALEQLLKLHATSAPLQGLGSTYLRIVGRATTAVTVAMRAFQAAPQFATAHTLALAQHSKGDWAAAIKTYKKLLELDPRATGVEVQLGDVYVELGEPAGGIAWFKKASADPIQQPNAAIGILAARYKRDHDAASLEERTVRQADGTVLDDDLEADTVPSADVRPPQIAESNPRSVRRCSPDAGRPGVFRHGSYGVLTRT